MGVSRYVRPGGWKKNISDGVKASAEIRQCPSCKRKGALNKLIVVDPGSLAVKECRYCGYLKKIQVPEAS